MLIAAVVQYSGSRWAYFTSGANVLNIVSKQPQSWGAEWRPTLNASGWSTWGRASLSTRWHWCPGHRHACCGAVQGPGTSEGLCRWCPKHGHPESDYDSMFQGISLLKVEVMSVSAAQVCLLRQYASFWRLGTCEVTVDLVSAAQTHREQLCVWNFACAVGRKRHEGREDVCDTGRHSSSSSSWIAQHASSSMVCGSCHGWWGPQQWRLLVSSIEQAPVDHGGAWDMARSLLLWSRPSLVISAMRVSPAEWVLRNQRGSCRQCPESMGKLVAHPALLLPMRGHSWVWGFLLSMGWLCWPGGEMVWPSETVLPTLSVWWFSIFCYTILLYSFLTGLLHFHKAIFICG